MNLTQVPDFVHFIGILLGLLSAMIAGSCMVDALNAKPIAWLFAAPAFTSLVLTIWLSFYWGFRVLPGLDVSLQALVSLAAPVCLLGFGALSLIAIALGRSKS